MKFSAIFIGARMKPLLKNINHTAEQIAKKKNGHKDGLSYNFH